MAWTSPRTWTTAEIVTAAMMNSDVRDNMNATMAGKVTTAGDYGRASGANAIARLPKGDALWQIAQDSIEGGTYRSLNYLGAAYYTTFASADKVGLGCRIQIGTGGAITGAQSSHAGRYYIAGGTTNPAHSGINGQNVTAAKDFWVAARVMMNSAASYSFLIGAKTTAADWVDENNIIAFRVVGTGTIKGICDSASTETERDTTVTPDGSTFHDLLIVVSGGGTTVQFYRNGTQVGADVTTNIPSGVLVTGMGTSNAANNSVMSIESFASAQKI